MADLLEMDMTVVEDDDKLEEILQRFQVFEAAKVEFDQATARQVTVVDLFEEGDVALLAQSWHSLDLGDAEGDGVDGSSPGRTVEIPEWRATILNTICERRSCGRATRLKDLLADQLASWALRASVAKFKARRMREQFQRRVKPSEVASEEEYEGSYECLLPAVCMMKSMDMVVDTGASHSIVAYCTVQRLQLKDMIKPTKKAFLTAGGELTFPIGEIVDLPMKVGGETILVTGMVVAKACFALLLSPDVLKPQGAVIDLKRSLFQFDGESAGGGVVTIALKCKKIRRTVSDVKCMQGVVGHVQMIKAIPAVEGPREGNIRFPELDPPGQLEGLTPISPKTEAMVNFPADAVLGEELTQDQRRDVLNLLACYKGVFESPDGQLPCTTLATH